ncbi:hypothetical protein [Agrobacterium rosae]|uniref:hypothetical protein n=1 Tax=Agrobacterium rosae TaxID=1972867 RepID=UPI001FEDC3E7|nr:hypothetical protein [Agrobacterium rosae]
MIYNVRILGTQHLACVRINNKVGRPGIGLRRANIHCGCNSECDQGSLYEIGKYIAHRYATLMLMIDGRINSAVFAQQES